MSSSSKPRHGEPVIYIKDELNRISGSMTPQFQQFIDELDATITAVAKLVIKDVSVTEDYTQDREDSGIFCNATAGAFSVTMIDPADAFKERVTVKNETGLAIAVSILATIGTVEITTLNDTESATFAPRPNANTPSNSKWVAV